MQGVSVINRKNVPHVEKKTMNFIYSYVLKMSSLNFLSLIKPFELLHTKTHSLFKAPEGEILLTTFHSKTITIYGFHIDWSIPFYLITSSHISWNMNASQFPNKPWITVYFVSLKMTCWKTDIHIRMYIKWAWKWEILSFLMIFLGLPNMNNEMIIKWEIIKLREILQIEIKDNMIL